VEELFIVIVVFIYVMATLHVCHSNGYDSVDILVLNMCVFYPSAASNKPLKDIDW